MQDDKNGENFILTLSVILNSSIELYNSQLSQIIS